MSKDEDISDMATSGPSVSDGSTQILRNQESGALRKARMLREKYETLLNKHTGSIGAITFEASGFLGDDRLAFSTSLQVL